MAVPPFSPRPQSQHVELLSRILDRVQADLPGALGSAITVHDARRDDPVTVLAARGAGEVLVRADPAGSGGPVSAAVEYQIPVVTLDLWSDERWPDLTPVAAGRSAPKPDTEWARVRGAAAVPGLWQGEETVVLSCVLDRPASAATVATLIGYEQLVNAAMVAAVAGEGTAMVDMLAVLQSRGAIEQAKGAIMGCLGCDAETAWGTLRRASHDSNVKLRELAVALVEHIGAAPAEQPVAGAVIVPDERARSAAQLLWAVLTGASRPVSVGD